MKLEEYVNLSKKQTEEFVSYEKELLKWNEVMNLTAITDHEEIELKHFIDSLTISSLIRDNFSVIDVGTGAGFPGIPLKIKNPTLNITLLDSLNKRVKFLNEVIKNLTLENIEAVHGRAEELGQNEKYREKYDYSVSRAVARFEVLLEYMAPFVKPGGKIIMMKGPKIEDELKSGKRALKELSCEIEEIKNFKLPDSDQERNIIIISKKEKLSKKYPRKPGIPAKMPL